MLVAVDAADHDRPPVVQQLPARRVERGDRRAERFARVGLGDLEFRVPRHHGGLPIGHDRGVSDDAHRAREHARELPIVASTHLDVRDAGLRGDDLRRASRQHAIASTDGVTWLPQHEARGLDRQVVTLGWTEVVDLDFGPLGLGRHRPVNAKTNVELG